MKLVPPSRGRTLNYFECIGAAEVTCKNLRISAVDRTLFPNRQEKFQTACSMNKSQSLIFNLPRDLEHKHVPAVNKVLRAPFFFCTSVTLKRRYTQEKHEMKSFDLQEIYEFDFSFFVVSRFVPKFRKFKKKMERPIQI